MAQQEPGVACVPVDYFSAVVNGTFTPAERAFLYRRETGHTTYDHAYVEGILSGDLLRLPAGPLGASLGFQLRHESIDDRPGPDFQSANAFNVSAAGRTHGYDNIEEIFGELNAPLLKGLPMIQNLGINVSGRYSNYRSSGSTATYKIGATWNLTDWLAFRATQATGFRAPALYELFLANQTSFLGQTAIDPCINYASSGASQTVQKNCASQGIAGDFVGGTTSAQIFTGGGIGNLKPETSTSKTVGVVFTPKWYGIDLSIAADYYTFDIRNQIQEFGAGNIVSACYDSTNFPNSPFCSLFTRNPANAPDNALGIAVVHDNFVNVARQIDQGLDVSLRFRHPLVWDTVFTLESELDWTFYTNTILLGGQTNNFLGQVGQPEFVGNANFRFDKGPWTFNWFLQMVGGTSDNKFVSDTDPNFHNTGESVFLYHRARFYSISTIALQRKFHDFTITAGVKNLFDKNPPAYSTSGFQNRIGTFPLATQYDLIGRSFFIDLKKTF
jgi:iron complex outermembrane receptor protein